MPKPNPSRRNFVRVTLPKTFKVEFGGETFDAFDLSVYGLSFFVDPDGSVGQNLKPGQILSPILFQVADRALSLDSRVTYIEVMRNGRYKVGVEFLEIGPTDVFFLSSFIVKRRKRSPISVGRVRVGRMKKKSSVKKRSVKKKSAKKKVAKKKKGAKRRR